MIGRINLYLLRHQLRQLRDTSYFSKNLRLYVSTLVDVVTHVLEVQSPYPDQVIVQLQLYLWRSYQYLRGSISRNIPYEVSYALQKALGDWIKEDTAITTALVDSQSYHFDPIDPWNFIKTSITHFPQMNFDVILIHVALPRLYNNKPLYCVPLYHELGHFIDMRFKVSELCMIKSGNINGRTLNHYREYFADLFAASYCGDAIGSTLTDIGGHHAASNTHPATADRLTVLNEYLKGGAPQIVQLFNRELTALGKPNLSLRFKMPDIEECFNRIVPYRLGSVDELHGLFPAGLALLKRAIRRESEPWASIEEFEIERIINDLVEKTIRNHSTVEKWKNASS